ncbi:MAG: light-independent protochlorophyllide reductase subunit B [uncultured bacterium]|nr:MAG: light-independent protochlorophyllide reductase subunit B [uncultured bacterium]
MFSYQGPSFLGGAKVGASFKNIQNIVNGPKGDGYVSDMIVMREHINDFPNVICSNMRSQDMFKGSLSRLFEIILNVLNKHPEDIILIFETCSSSLLKEDLKTAIHALKNDEKARIFFYENDYFKESEDISASNTLLHLVENFPDINVRKKNNSANIIGPCLLNFNYSHDLKAIKSILDDLKININLTIPYGCSIYDLKHIGKASLNICSDIPLSFKTAEHLKEKFKQPYLFPPYGFKGTSNFISGLENCFEKDTANYIQEKENILLKKYSDFMKENIFENKRIFLFGDMTTVAGLCMFFKNDFNAENIIAGSYNIRFQEMFFKLIDNSNINCFFSDDSLEVEEKINEFKPDLIMGTLNEERYSNINRIPFIRISSPMRQVETVMYPFQSFMGYKGLDFLLSKLKEISF